MELITPGRVGAGGIKDLGTNWAASVGLRQSLAAFWLAFGTLFVCVYSLYTIGVEDLTLRSGSEGPVQAGKLTVIAATSAPVPADWWPTTKQEVLQPFISREMSLQKPEFVEILERSDGWTYGRRVWQGSAKLSETWSWRLIPRPARSPETFLP